MTPGPATRSKDNLITKRAAEPDVTFSIHALSPLRLQSLIILQPLTPGRYVLVVEDLIIRSPYVGSVHLHISILLTVHMLIAMHLRN